MTCLFPAPPVQAMIEEATETCPTLPLMVSEMPSAPVLLKVWMTPVAETVAAL